MSNDYLEFDNLGSDVKKIEIVGLGRLTTALEVLAGIKPKELVDLEMRAAMIYDETKYAEPTEVEGKMSQAFAEVNHQLTKMLRDFELTGKWKKENKEC